MWFAVWNDCSQLEGLMYEQLCFYNNLPGKCQLTEMSLPECTKKKKSRWDV